MTRMRCTCAGASTFGETIMIPALLETIGALSLLVSIAAKIALLRGLGEEETPEPRPVPSIRPARAACFRRKARQHDPGHLHGAHGERRMRYADAARDERKHLRNQARGIEHEADRRRTHGGRG